MAARTKDSKARRAPTVAKQIAEWDAGERRDAIGKKIDEIIQLANNVESSAREWADIFKALVNGRTGAKESS